MITWAPAEPSPGQGEAEHAGPADDDGRLAVDGKQIVEIGHYFGSFRSRSQSLWNTPGRSMR